MTHLLKNGNHDQDGDENDDLLDGRCAKYVKVHGLHGKVDSIGAKSIACGQVQFSSAKWHTYLMPTANQGGTMSSSLLKYSLFFATSATALILSPSDSLEKKSDMF